MDGKKYRVRPGRGVSIVGFVVSLVFAFLGMFFIIPGTSSLSSSGIPGANIGVIFGFFWTVIALCGAVYNWYNAFSDRGIAEVEIHEFKTSKPGSNTVQHESIKASDRLRELKQLREQNLITAEEYERKRTDILNNL